MRSITKVTLIVFGIASCQGITQNVETLRAERVEIVDDKGGVKMDVATKIRTLEDRIAKLEAALEKVEKKQAEAQTAPIVVTPPPSTTAKPKPPTPNPAKSDVF